MKSAVSHSTRSQQEVDRVFQCLDSVHQTGRSGQSEEVESSVSEDQKKCIQLNMKNFFVNCWFYKFSKSAKYFLNEKYLMLFNKSL